MPTIQVPLFNAKEKQEIEQQLRELREAAEREVANAPSQRQEILDRYEVEVARYVEARREKSLARHYEGLVWGEAIGGGFLAVGAIFEWSIPSFFGFVIFLVSWVNTWFEGRKTYANTRLHGYVFSSTFIVIALLLLIHPGKSYDPESNYRIEHRRNGTTVSWEDHSGREMQMTEDQRLEVWKTYGMCLLVIGAGVLLRTSTRGIRRSGSG